VRAIDPTKLLGVNDGCSYVGKTLNTGGLLDFAFCEDYNQYPSYGMNDFQQLQSWKAQGRLRYIGMWVDLDTNTSNVWAYYHYGDTVLVLPWTNAGVWTGSKDALTNSILPVVSLATNPGSLSPVGAAYLPASGGRVGRSTELAFLTLANRQLAFAPFGQVWTMATSPGEFVAINLASNLFVLAEIVTILGLALIFALIVFAVLKTHDQKRRKRRSR
jgi:hypothetical protein